MTPLLPSPHRRSPVARALATALIVGLLTATAIGAQPEPLASPQDNGKNEPKLTLLECLRIAQERQPTIAAARASLQAKLTAKRAVDQLQIHKLLAPDLPIRRQQALRGLDAAYAELYQAEYDTSYAVVRMYYSAVYARQQSEVTDDVVRNLRFWQERVRDIVQKQGGDRELNQDTVDRLTIGLRLAESKQAEALVGAERALAALREAMGVGVDCGPFRPFDARMPEPTAQPNREEIIALALARRGELVQALVAADVVRLEECAQGMFRLRPQARTFAASSDVHAKSLPTGLSNGEYRPGAVGIEIPANVAGSRESRMEQIRWFAVRADAVVQKTRGLITLEAENAYQNWVESTRKVNGNREAAQVGRELAERVRKTRGLGNIKQEDLLQTDVLAGQAQAAYNEALYNQILALANLERITAGGFISGIVPPPASAVPTP